MGKGTFGGLGFGEKVKIVDIKKQLRKLQIRKKELIKSGKFTPDRRSYFKEQEVELKRALR